MNECPACGAGVSPQASFCPECGRPVAGRCSVCGAGLPPNARFCAECGGAAEPGGMEGERRQLSVAFCELVGSTELSTELDPERFAELIQEYRRRTLDAAARYGGEVEKYLGDGIVFRFGWPEAHDDDPECAVRAALEMVDEIGQLAEQFSSQRLAARVGVHTGPAVVGMVDAEEGTETMALGETLNLAALLQGIARPGTVIASATTLDLTPGIFVAEDLGPSQLEGVLDRVRAYRVVQASGVRGRLDAGRGTLTTFINREVELSMLQKRWAQAQTRGGQAVLILGEPGVGKSRLVYQLRERIGGTPHIWLECGCSSYTAQSAFRPAIDLIAEGLQMDPDDSPAERLAKLEGGLAAAEVKSEDALPLLATLLAIPVSEGFGPLTMSPDRRRHRTIELLVEWVLGLTRLQPVVLFAEDLQWSDPSTLELFGELIGHGRGSQLLLVGAARAEFPAPWGVRPNLTVLSVGPLPDEELRQMVRTVGKERDLPEEMVERIAGESGGIPLYAEEIGRMVLESGVLPEGSGVAPALAELEIPTTLQGSLMARLDRLSAAKVVAQVASVVGREFSYALLEQVSDLAPAALEDGVARLVDSELLFEQGAPPRATYTFKHALIQDAAYQSLLKRTRRRLHERIADTLQRLTEDPLALPEVIARHYEAAERTEAAIDHYQRAAEDAAERSGYREAIAHLDRATKLSATLPESTERDKREVEMQLALGSAIIATRSYADPAIEAAYERALRLCQGLGDDRQVAEALAGLSIFYVNRGNLDRGGELAERVLEIGQLDEDDELRLLGHVQCALPRVLRAEYEVALEHAERAWEIYDPDRHRSIAFRFGTDHGVVAHCFAGWSLMGLGYLDGALGRMRAAVELGRRLGHPFSLAYALIFETGVHWVRGDGEAQRSTAGAAQALAAEQGFDLWTGISRVYIAAEDAGRTHDPAVIPELLEGSLVAGETGNRAGSSPLLACVAEAQWAVGDLEAALGTVRATLALSEETGQTWWDAELERMWGELLLAGAETTATPGEAEDHLRRALDTGRRQRARVHELRAATSIAERVLVPRGDTEEAAKLLGDAYEPLSEGFSTAPLRAARELLDQLGAPASTPKPASG